MSKRSSKFTPIVLLGLIASLLVGITVLAQNFGDIRTGATQIRADATDQHKIRVALPSYTTAERDLLDTPIAGEQIWNTTTNRREMYNGTAWTPQVIKLSPYDFGAKGDGTTDDTAAWQAMVNRANELGGAVCDGNNDTYVLSFVNVNSNTIVENAKVITKAYNGVGNFFYSPFTIGGYDDSNLRENITFRNVHVNGNRSNQTGFIASEDSGRHGFRVIGRVENLLIEDCSAFRCAADGICFFIGNENAGLRSYTESVKKNIKLIRFHAYDNRRHGGSADNIEDFHAIDCVFTNNGKDINGGLTEGDTGAEFGGLKYGHGWDWEEHTSDDYTGLTRFTKCKFTQNAGKGFGYVPIITVLSDDPSFVPRGPWYFSECTFDKGGDIENFAISMLPAVANEERGPYCRDVSFIECINNGIVVLRAMDRLRFVGGSYRGVPGVDISLRNVSRAIPNGIDAVAAIEDAGNNTILAGFRGVAPTAMPANNADIKDLLVAQGLAQNGGPTSFTTDNGDINTGTGYGRFDGGIAIGGGVADVGIPISILGQAGADKVMQWARIGSEPAVYEILRTSSRIYDWYDPVGDANRMRLDFDNGNLTVGGSLTIGGGTAIAQHLSGTVTWNPASVNNAAQTTTTVTVTGAAVGDTVAVGFGQDLQLMVMTGYVSSANTVTVILRNNTGAAIDLASGTLRADVWKH